MKPRLHTGVSRHWALPLCSIVLIAFLVACSDTAEPERPTAASRTAEAPDGEPTPSPTTPPAEAKGAPTKKEEEPPSRWVTERPAWLGTRVLPLGPEGFGEVRPTPPLLRNRRFATVDLFPPPERERFRATIQPVPDSVAERSTYRPKCPVTLDELAYVKMTFWGFDREVHLGEMLINASVAEDVVSAFSRLFDARFPIEEMRVATLKEMRAWDRAPTGDTNLTSSFECREVTQGTNWSQHAYGLALDINPFHNPYLDGALVGPELASAYLDRGWERPGMIHEGGPAVAAFDAIGWSWGGRWSSIKDWMHFSLYGN